jgi:hypothetical protein
MQQLREQQQARNEDGCCKAGKERYVINDDDTAAGETHLFRGEGATGGRKQVNVVVNVYPHHLHHAPAIESRRRRRSRRCL